LETVLLAPDLPEYGMEMSAEFHWLRTTSRIDMILGCKGAEACFNTGVPDR
jgi:hypothetical protein